MALQWLILTYVVAAEAAVALLLTLPYPKLLKNRLVSLFSLIVQPALFIVPFSGFHLLGLRSLSLSIPFPFVFSAFTETVLSFSLLLLADIYWKNEHRLECTSEICTAEERDRYEKSIYKAQRNVILCVTAALLYWCIHSICKYNKEIKMLEEAEKRSKDE
ncbi:hypothetical protein V6N13_021748 [Hibiscus sabdariffa]|uniref:Endoplasmic reticulum transmembrane protein n=1 Tax=Hibiscus sabdariffa TaxID=183260 RepID=A0ABR2BA29_9ROSI